MSQLAYRFCLCSILTFFSLFASSAPLPPSIRDEIENKQKQRLDEIKTQNEQLKNLHVLPTLPQNQLVDEGACFNVRILKLVGNTKFNDKVLINAAGFTPKCIGLKSINDYLSKISNYYIKHGFITSRAYLTPQNLKSGILTIVILEGKIKEIQLNGKENKTLEFIFPSIKGEILNLRDIEQGLDQVNRLRRYNARIKLIPSEIQGYSIVNIETDIGSSANGMVGFNNSGSSGTGETQITASFGLENAFSLLESINVSGSGSSEFNHSYNSESINLNMDFPMGYWNYDLQMVNSKYKSSFDYNGVELTTNGNTSIYKLGMDWVFFRNGQIKTKFKSSVNHRRQNNYIMGSKLESSSYNLSHVTLGIEFSSRLGRSFITVFPAFSRGTSWFNAITDHSVSTDTPVSKFDKEELTLSYTYPFTQSLSYSSTLYGQWSDDKLYSNQQISIGGEYSVRGFKNISIVGDSGYYWRNQFNYQIGQWPIIGIVNGVLAFDYGAIDARSKDEVEGNSLIGSSLTISTQNKYYSSSFSAGVPLHSPKNLNADDYVVSYQIQISF